MERERRLVRVWPVTALGRRVLFRLFACLFACVFSCILACGERAPRTALEAYRQALARRDAQALWALSSSEFRKRHTADRLADVLAHSSSEVAALERVMSELDVDRASLSFERGDGQRVTLVPEEDGYRISGALEGLVTDTPESALRTLFRGFSTADGALLRQVMPSAHAARFGGDEALLRAVLRAKERVARAEAMLAPVGDNLAIIDGNSARIRYGTGLAVRFVKEDGRWRVLDVE